MLRNLQREVAARQPEGLAAIIPHNEFKGRPALVRERSRVQSSLAAPRHAIDLAARSAASRKIQHGPGHPERDEGMDSEGKKERSHLPMPNAERIGLITYDAKDPDEEFRRSNSCVRRQGAPNVLIVLIDDTGFGASSAFGGPCQTPNAERLAAGGLKFNRFHTTALCSPTRQALLTGRNHHPPAWAASPRSPPARRVTPRCCPTPCRRWRGR